MNLFSHLNQSDFSFKIKQKIFPLFITFLLLSVEITAQAFSSTCTPVNTDIQRYRSDAMKLTIKRQLAINSTYKDSANLDHAIYNRYLTALVAVYNCTALPQRDTVIDHLNVHVMGSYGSADVLNLYADTNLLWMQNLIKNVFPTGNDTIDYLINSNYLHKTGYSLNQGAHISFRTDSIRNLVVVAQKLKEVFGVYATMQYAQVIVYFGEHYGTNIIDKVGPDYIDLTYVMHAGDCPAGCTYKAFWKFRVYDSCAVEFLEHTGPYAFQLLSGLTSETSTGKIIVTPNPASEHINFINHSLLIAAAEILVTNTDGTIKYYNERCDLTKGLNISSWEKGLYYLTIKIHDTSETYKIIKQ